MKKIIAFTSFAAMLALLVACYPGGPDYYSDLDIVATDYKPDYWSNNNPSTYYMNDTVGFILDRLDEENNVELDHNYDATILNQIASNMTAAGYTRVDDYDTANPPDVIVFVQALAVESTYVGWIPSYPYWGYWGGYYPYYGYGYPVSYSYTTGTLFIEMVNQNEIDTENKILPVVWFAAVDGLLRSSTAENQSFIKYTIDQAFKQSPYLNN